LGPSDQGVGLLCGCGRFGLPGDAGVGEGDGERAFGALFEEWAVGLVILMGAVGVEELHTAGAEYFETVVEVCAGGEILSAEAGAGVVDFEEFDGLSGVIADGRGDVGGVAAYWCEKSGEESEGWDPEHER